MKKIHTHFLECSTPDCAICKKLKPLTYIHAKHCTVVPGEQCVIPYCARAKMELQVRLSFLSFPSHLPRLSSAPLLLLRLLLLPSLTPSVSPSPPFRR